MGNKLSKVSLILKINIHWWVLISECIIKSASLFWVKKNKQMLDLLFRPSLNFKIGPLKQANFANNLQVAFPSSFWRTLCKGQGLNMHQNSERQTSGDFSQAPMSQLLEGLRSTLRHLHVRDRVLSPDEWTMATSFEPSLQSHFCGSYPIFQGSACLNTPCADNTDLLTSVHLLQNGVILPHLHVSRVILKQELIGEKEVCPNHKFLHPSP